MHIRNSGSAGRANSPVPVAGDSHLEIDRTSTPGSEPAATQAPGSTAIRSVAKRRRRGTVAVAMLLISALTYGALLIDRDGGDPGVSVPLPPTQGMSVDELTKDLVNRGLIPKQTLDPAERTPDEITRDLIDRGLIPE